MIGSERWSSAREKGNVKENSGGRSLRYKRAIGKLNQTTLWLVPFEFSFKIACAEQLNLVSD